jgi:uncharacterized protein YPO0396
MLSVGCTDNRTEAEQQVRTEAAKTDAVRERAEARQRLSDRIDAMDRRMEEYQDRLGKASRNARVEGEKNLDKMKAETRELRAKLARLDDQAASQWDEFKADTERALEKAENSMKEAWDKITD